MTNVFVSYRQEDDEHRARVRAFAERLRQTATGADLVVTLDQFAQEDIFNGGGPNEGWPQWSTSQAAGEDQKVLVIATAGWFLSYEGKTPAGQGRGAAVEAGVIRQRLYNSAGNNPHIRFVLLGGSKPTFPVELQRYHVFDGDSEVPTIVRWLTGSRGASPAPPAQATPEFPISLSLPTWPVADRSSVRDALGKLLTHDCPYRVMLIEGATEHGKSLITKQLLGNALTLEWLACGRFDFKGTTSVDDEFTGFLRYLDIEADERGGRISERLGLVLKQLLRAGRPTLLIFDTYEDAGEAALWLEEHLLTAVIRSSWLRIVIAGQRVPNSAVAPWGGHCLSVIRLTPLEWRDWLEYGRSNGSTATETFVREVFERSDGKPSVLRPLLERRA